MTRRPDPGPGRRQVRQGRRAWKGAALICSGAARRGDCLMGVQLGFIGVQLGGKCHLGRFTGLRLRYGAWWAATGGCHCAAGHYSAQHTDFHWLEACQRASSEAPCPLPDKSADPPAVGGRERSSSLARSSGLTRSQPGIVTNAHNGTGLGTVSAFADSPSGSLTTISGSPYADQQTAPCWLTISHDGQYLFAVNTGSGTISRYAITPDGELALLGSVTVSATASVGAVDPGLSPDGRFLFLNESRIDALGAFAVSGGSLTELPSSPTALPAGATPAGIAVS